MLKSPENLQDLPEILFRARQKSRLQRSEKERKVDFWVQVKSDWNPSICVSA
jgi:hypothetical protein